MSYIFKKEVFCDLQSEIHLVQRSIVFTGQSVCTGQSVRPLKIYSSMIILKQYFFYVDPKFLA